MLAGQVELKNFAPRQRIYKMGDQAGTLTSWYRARAGHHRGRGSAGGVVDQPAAGEFFGFASMLEQTPHQTTAVAMEETVCLEVDRNDIAVLLQRKPHGRAWIC